MKRYPNRFKSRQNPSSPLDAEVTPSMVGSRHTDLFKHSRDSSGSRQRNILIPLDVDEKMRVQGSQKLTISDPTLR